jgi:hypothetical protein
MTEPIKGGASKGHSVSQKDLDTMLDEYYEARGWDKVTSAPTRAKLARAEIGGALKHLQELAATHKRTVRELTPDVNTLTDASGNFLVQFLANGQFMDLRGFLIDIGALPYFESIEEIEIKAVEGNTKENGLKISLRRE